MAHITGVNAATRLVGFATVFVVFVCTAILSVAGWREWSERQSTLNAVEIDMSNMARSLTQHAEDSIALADTVIAGIVDRLERKDGLSQANVQSSAVLRTLRSSTDRIRGLFIYGEDGQWLATSEEANLRGFNNADRDYFIYHRTHPSRVALIGDPVQSRAGSQWIVTVSRRFNHTDGSFAGVVLATIDVAYFTEFYSHFDVRDNGSIALLTNMGKVLARFPADRQYVGRDLSKSSLFVDKLPLQGSGAHEFLSPLDGRQRLSFYHTGARYHLVVLATAAKEAVLAGWWRAAVVRMGFAMTLVTLIAVIGGHLIRQLGLRAKMMTALAEREADFRLLAEGSSDMVMRIAFDGTLRYVSPSSLHVLGWRSEQLTGGHALAGINVQDRASTEQAIAALQAGRLTEAKLLYRTRHREKGEIWLETTLRVTRSSETGVIDGVVAISRDMTDHKDIEDRLAQLASTDALTGVANRRCFDEQLIARWGHAAREDTSLSLLLIDLDQFKKYNDRYGHQAGDLCLKAAAHCIAEQASRPSDIVARYGGEELAVILPDTDAEGCAAVAHRILQSIRELRLPHADNLPSQTVSASIGAGTSRPARDIRSDPAKLLRAVDMALYGAKEAGRDRVVSAGQVIPLRRGTA